jgi:hypothetical protein
MLNRNQTLAKQREKTLVCWHVGKGGYRYFNAASGVFWHLAA